MAPRSWQIQEAKNKLSELIDQASADLPQLITRRGKPVAYVVSADTWERRSCPSLRTILRRCPHPQLFDEITRDPSPGREIEL
jgi:prevent-host-death family protein